MKNLVHILSRSTGSGACIFVFGLPMQQRYLSLETLMTGQIIFTCYIPAGIKVVFGKGSSLDSNWVKCTNIISLVTWEGKLIKAIRLLISGKSVRKPHQ